MPNVTPVGPRIICALWIAAVLAGEMPARADETRSAPPAAGQVPLVGVVVDEDDRPVSGATIEAYTVEYGSSLMDSMGRRVASGQTGEEGGFSLSIDPFSKARIVYVLARKAGLSLGWHTAYWRDDQFHPAGPLQIVLAEPEPLGGTVVDPAGQPVSGARIQLLMARIVQNAGRPMPSHIRAVEGMKPLLARSGPDGQFAFESLPADAKAALIVRAPGRATTQAGIDPSIRPIPCVYRPGQEDLRVVLEPEAVIEGTVIDPNGRGVAGVKVGASPPLPHGGADATAVTDEQGRFRLVGLSGGEHKLHLRSPLGGGMPEWISQPVPATTRAGEVTADVVLPVHRGALLIVTVTDEETGQPLEGAQLGLRREDARGWRVSRTDENGRARFRVPPGVYRIVQASAEKYSRLNKSESTIRLAEGDQRRQTLALAPLPTLEGVVTDPDGRPVAGAQVQVLPGAGRSGEAISDVKGEFSIAVGAVGHGGWQPEGRVIVVRHHELGLAWAAVLDESVERIRASLTPGIVLAGTVTDEAGQPLAGVRVNVMLRAFRWGSSLGMSRATDPSGRYRIGPLPTGQRYSVRAMAEGFGEGEADLRTGLDGAGEVRVEPIKLPRADLSISGAVVDGEGEPVAGVSVSVQGDRQPHRHVRTDENGRFTLEGIIDGTVRVTAHRPNSGGSRFGQVETTGGSKDVTVVLGRHSLSSKPAPPPIRKLLGRPLPGLEQVGLGELAERAEGKRLLVCVWDWHQRPSRRTVRQLASRADALAKRGLITVTVHASPADADRLQDWADKYEMALPVGRSGETSEQSAKMRRAFGVRALPWLILTDRGHIVTAEGFPLRELDSKLE